MTDIDKEVINSHDYLENEIKKTTQGYQDKCSIAEKCFRQISPREDTETQEISNTSSPCPSQDSGILSVASSYPGSVYSSSYFPSEASPCMLTPSTVQEDEGPYDQFSSSPSSPAVLLNALNIVGQGKHEQGTIPVLETNNQVKESRKDLESTIPVLETINQVKESRKDLERKQRERILEFKTSVQGNWQHMKDITELSMTSMFEKVGLAKEDDLRCLNNATRSKAVDMLIMRVLQRIQTDTDIRNFKEIVGIQGELKFRHAKYYHIKEIDHINNMKRLYLNRKFLIEKLMTVDIEEVKDRLLQEDIINMDENDRIITHQGFCERRNPRFSKYFVDEYIIGKTFFGSYQCLVEYLRQMISDGSTRLRQLLESLTSEDLNQTDTAVKEPIVYMRVLQTDYSEKETVESSADKDIEMEFKFNIENEDTKKVYYQVQLKAKTNNGTTGKDLGGCITKTELGSVVIHMVALQKEMIQNILNLFRKKQFSNVVKTLFNDKQIKRCLPSGMHELEVTCYVKEKQENFVQGTCCKVHKLNHIADNKTFLEEEMDTLIVLKEFEKLGLHIGIDAQNGDRRSRARKIIEKALSDDKIAKMLHKVLSESEMTNVKNRLWRYETVYGSDSSQLQKNIHTHFKEITRKVFLDDIRLIFTERNIFKAEIFEAEDKTGAENEIAMANILTEIIKRNDAMLTLVDALFQIQLETLGKKLMKLEPLDEDKIETKMAEPKRTKKQTKKSSDKHLLMTGRFEISIRRSRKPPKKRSPIKNSSKPKAVTCKRQYHHWNYVTLAATCRNDVRDNGRYCEKYKIIKLEEHPRDTYLNYQQKDTEDNYCMYAHVANMSNCFPAPQMDTNNSQISGFSGLSFGDDMSVLCSGKDNCTIIATDLCSQLLDTNISDIPVEHRISEDDNGFKCIQRNEHYNEFATKDHHHDSRIPTLCEEDSDFNSINGDNHFNNISAEKQVNLGYPSVSDKFYQQRNASPLQAPSPSSTVSAADSGYSTYPELDDPYNDIAIDIVMKQKSQSNTWSAEDIIPLGPQNNDPCNNIVMNIGMKQKSQSNTWSAEDIIPLGPQNNDKASLYQQSDASLGYAPSPTSIISAADSGYSTHPDPDGLTEIPSPVAAHMEDFSATLYYSTL